MIAIAKQPVGKKIGPMLFDLGYQAILDKNVKIILLGRNMVR